MNDPRAFRRIDEERDERFYDSPRFVEHIDDHAVRAIEALYRERLSPRTDVLDLMSSWVSHLPVEVAFASVTGLGMNARELERNPRLTRSVVHDLNADPQLPFEEATFDAALICVSIQYLTQPVFLFRELARVVRPGGTLLTTFSNRCFPTKAVAIWRITSDRDHLALVSDYVRSAGSWSSIEAFETKTGGDPLFVVAARRESSRP